MITAERYHDISCGHRVVGHENKCRFLHGHNYRIHFSCVAPGGLGDELDPLGRVIDFGVIKSRLCQWLENHWDHRFLVWEHDFMCESLAAIAKGYSTGRAQDAPSMRPFREFVNDYLASFVQVPFNPTAENMAKYLVQEIGPRQLEGTGVALRAVRIEETRKCSAVYSRKA